MRSFKMETVIPASPDAVWEFVTRPDGIIAVAKGYFSFTPIDPATFPIRWEKGDYLTAIKAFGLVPAGRQLIRISFPVPDGETRILRDSGGGLLFSEWDHRISVAPKANAARRETLYTDDVRFDAKIAPGITLAVVKSFFRHRHKRLAMLFGS
ncbi:MAG: hypothetical protein AAF850_11685 [Pseudomonadota bacterium]